MGKDTQLREFPLPLCDLRSKRTSPDAFPKNFHLQKPHGHEVHVFEHATAHLHRAYANHSVDASNQTPTVIQSPRKPKKEKKEKKKLCSISRQLVTPVDPSPDTPAGQTRPACRHSTSNRVERPHSKHMAPVPCPSRPFFLMEKEMGNPSQSTTPSRKGKKKGIGESHQRTDVTHSINFQPHASNPTPFLFPSHQLQPTTIPFRTHQPSQAVS